MSLTNPNDIVTEQRLAEFYQGIYPYLGAINSGSGPSDTPTVYGMYIANSSESVPSEKIAYLYDAVGMTPASMNFTTKIFSYGSWEDAFFMPKPCMLKYDGTVDYYLDPNDYTKKEDGTASDVADPTYPGNAMMEWPKIWLKIVPDTISSGKSCFIYISDENADGTYTDWPYHNSLGQSVNHFYTAIYSSSLIDGRLRSISGQTAMKTKTAQEELTASLANNPSGSVIWTTETIASIDLIRYLLMLIGKSTDSQGVFGQGLSSSVESYLTDYFTIGVHNDKGLFYGTNENTGWKPINTVKVFGMENWWGMQGRRYLGEIIDNGVRKRKLTYGTEDGSTVTGYNLTGEGYRNTGVDVISGSATNGIIKECTFNEFGMLPTTNGGSTTNHYCDTYTYNSSILAVPYRGARTDSQLQGGAFATYLNELGTAAYWYVSANLFACPLS